MHKKTQLILSSILVLSIMGPVAWSETSIRITNGEWEPYMSEYSAHYGFNSHVVTEAFKLEGISIEWGFYPWSRAYSVAKHGSWDASATWWPSEETLADFLVSDPISETSFVFFHLKSRSFDWQNMSDLKSLRIGGTIEYDYGREMMDAINRKHVKMQLTPTDEQNYKKLLRNRIDIFPNDPIVGYAQIRNSLSPDEAKMITYHPKEFEVSTLHLIISKKIKRANFFLEKFNKGFKKLKSSPAYDEMLKGLQTGKYDKKKEKWQDHRY